MKPISLHELSQAVGGHALSPIPSGVAVAAVCTDTRQMRPGSLFVALRGDAHDGHRYLADAAAGGATAALVEVPVEPPPGMHLLRVDSTRHALGRLASYLRQELGGKVIAVGGSNGKTGTKHLIHSTLSVRLSGTISPKSFNNDIGVPLAIFAADPTHDYLVLEMGTNHHGELRVLSRMGQPDIAVITNCGPEHLEGLSDMDGVIREEASLIEGLRRDGLLVVNGDDPRLLDAVSAFPGRKFSFGLQSHNDLQATDIRCGRDGVRFRLNAAADFLVPLLGSHVACNALAAIAVGRELGLGDAAIANGLARASGPEMRLQLQTIRGIDLLNDAYNANPASMKAALQTLCELPTHGRRIAVLGDMRELGDTSDAYHRELGEQAAACGLQLLVCVGEKAALTAESARQVGMPSARILHFANANLAAVAVPERIGEGDLVLLKGSRSMKLEIIARAIEADQRKAAS